MKRLRRTIVSRILILIAALAVASAAHPQGSSGSYSIGISIIRGNRPDCPAFIGAVMQKSPAEKAGVQPGDVLVAVDGTPVRFEEAAQRLRSRTATPVTLSLKRGERGDPITVVVQREPMETILRDGGEKIVQGRVLPLDFTDEEVSCLLRFDTNRIVGQAAFRPTHYPENLSLYYPGFEAFTLDSPPQIAVGGVEQGPASEAGVRWGDILVSVDGVSVQGKDRAQLEAMLSSNTPRKISLVVDRCGQKRNFSFDLQRADEIMKQNRKQEVSGEIMPLGIPRHYFSCFVGAPPKTP